MEKMPQEQMDNSFSDSQRDFVRMFEKTVAIFNILSKEQAGRCVRCLQQELIYDLIRV